MQIYSPSTVRTEEQLWQQTNRLRRHPRFDETILSYTRDLYARREIRRPFSKLIANEDRFKTLNFLFSMWAESMARDGAGTFTYGELFELCRRGEVTPRILKTTLAIATHAGYVDRLPNPEDARSWLYRPTAEMLAFPYSFLIPAAEALDVLLPSRPWSAALRDDRAVLVHLYRSGGREFAAGLQPITMMPDFMAFCGGREGGSVVAIGLFIAHVDGTRPPSRLELTRRFGLSKTQVAQVISAGEAMGYLTMHSGTPRATQRLLDEHVTFSALSLAFLGHHLWPDGYRGLPGDFGYVSDRDIAMAAP